MRATAWQKTLTFLVWALVGLSAAYWGLRLGEGPSIQSLPPVPPKVPGAGVSAQALAAALGGAPRVSEPAPSAARRLELRGVIAEGRRGVALLAVDGQAAQPYAVGAAIADGLKLASVGAAHAEVVDAGTGALVQRLEMPPRAALEVPPGLRFVPAGRP